MIHRRRDTAMAVRLLPAIAVVAAVATFAACQVPQATPPDGTLPNPSSAPVPLAVNGGSYGPDPQQLFNLYLPTSPPAGGAPLIIWMHGGGWTGGDRTEANTSEAVLHEVSNGDAVASIDYHLVHDGGTFPVPIQDAKRAVRYFKANAARWNLDPSKVLLAGLSAGAYNAALATVSGPGQFEPTNLPPALAAVDSSVIGAIDMIGPIDLPELAAEPPWLGTNLEQMTTAFLGCPTTSFSSCDPTEVAQASILSKTTATTPPTYLAYGDQDTLAPASMGKQLDDAYTSTGRNTSTWFDTALNTNHSLAIDYSLNLTYFDSWVNGVITGGIT
jgi:acetyl esterase/lipase